MNLIEKQVLNRLMGADYCLVQFRIFPDGQDEIQRISRPLTWKQIQRAARYIYSWKLKRTTSYYICKMGRPDVVHKFLWNITYEA